MKPYNNSNWLKYTGIASQLLVLIGLAVYGGIKLDERWHISPALTIALPMLALAMTFYQLITETNKKKNKDGNTD